MAGCAALAAGCGFDEGGLVGVTGGPAPSDATADTVVVPPDGPPADDAGGDASPDGVGDAGADAGPDAALPPDAVGDGLPPACTGVETACLGDGLYVCAAGSWALDRTCPLGCGAAPPRCLYFDPENVPAGLLFAGTAAWQIGQDVVVSSDTGSGLPGDVTLTFQSQPGGPEITIIAVASLTVDQGAMLTITGTRAVAIIASDFIQIDGTMDVSASGPTAGPGGYGGGGPYEAGAAPSGATAAAHGTNQYSWDDSGGSGGCHGAIGGAGGPGGAATSPGQGSVFGTTTGSPLLGGGGGGSGSGITCGGPGGGGGGAIELAAYRRITITGTVIAGGGGGSGGCDTTTNWGSGGGGGAGGGVLVEAPVVDVSGTLAANGGGGGGGAYDTSGQNGQTGGGSATPAAGGAGGRDGDSAWGRGGAGGAGSTAALAGSNGAGSLGNGGGGGGAVGRVVVYTRSGTAPGGTISPPATANPLVAK
jgi:hypothetical protein